MPNFEIYGDAYINVSGHVLEVEHSLVPEGHYWFQLPSSRRLGHFEATNRGKSTQVLIDRGYLKKTTYVPTFPSQYLIFEAYDEPGHWFSIAPETSETPNHIIERPQISLGNEVWILPIGGYGKIEGVNVQDNTYQVRYISGGLENVDVFPFLDLLLASYYNGETTHDGVYYDSWFGYSYTTERIDPPDPSYIIDYDFTIPSGSYLKLLFPNQEPPKEALFASLGGSRENPRFVFRRLSSGSALPVEEPVAVPASSTATIMRGSHAFRFLIDQWGRLGFERTQ